MAFQLLLPIAMAALGTFQAVNTYQSQKDRADAISKQAKLKREAEAHQLELDSRAEATKVDSERDKRRRHRDNMLAQYATSGVLIDGSAAHVLEEQREIDEVNIQRMHQVGNSQRKLDNWKSETDYNQSMYAAKSLRSASKVGLFTDLGTTALGFGLNSGMFSSASKGIGGSVTSTTGSPYMAGQTWNMNYYNSVT